MRPLVIGTVVAASLTQGAVVFSQDAPAPAAVAQPAAAPTPDFLHQEALTGDWNGRRTRWKDKGFELESSLTQFYQGVSSGGTGTSSEYNGTAQALLKVDLGKLAGWQFWSAEIKAETRFGGPLVTSTGTISPVNTAAIIPGADGTVFSVTAVNFTKLFPVNLKEGKLFAVSFGATTSSISSTRTSLREAVQSDSSIISSKSSTTSISRRGSSSRVICRFFARTVRRRIRPSFQPCD